MATDTKVLPCACGARPADGDPATAVDPDVKHAISTRLRRIEGQVRGILRMVDEERFCSDVLTQISSVQEALRGVSRTLLHNHLKYCAAEAIRSGNPDEADAIYDELMDLMYRSAK
jgi:DNA-binding FrmR family transcriptional regulator